MCNFDNNKNKSNSKIIRVEAVPTGNIDMYSISSPQQYTHNRTQNAMMII